MEILMLQRFVHVVKAVTLSAVFYRLHYRGTFVYLHASLMHVGKPLGLSVVLLYLVGALSLVLAVRVAAIRVVSGGPGQSTVLLPEITERDVSGDLNTMDKV